MDSSGRHGRHGRHWASLPAFHADSPMTPLKSAITSQLGFPKPWRAVARCCQMALEQAWEHSRYKNQRREPTGAMKNPRGVENQGQQKVMNQPRGEGRHAEIHSGLFVCSANCPCVNSGFPGRTPKAPCQVAESKSRASSPYPGRVAHILPKPCRCSASTSALPRTSSP